MKRSAIAKFACAVALAAVCGSALVSCAGNTADASDENVDIYDTSEGVAATVNGTEIGEKAVTTYIQNFRTQGALEDDNDWGQWLVDNDYTVDDIRSQVIDYYASQQLLRQAAEENGVTANADDVNSQIETMRSYYNSDEEWDEALKSVGMTEASYRSTLELSILENGLKEKVATVTEPSDEDMLQYAQMYASAYDGAKKSSHILFASDDEVTAQEVLDKINAGELDFAEAAKEYSQDTGSAEDGGNVGWDKMTSFVDEYQTALDGLEKDQVSGLVTSSYGIHIIKCTDVFTAPEEVTSLDQIPTEFVDSIKSSLEEQSREESFSEWYQNYKDSADIQINDKPEGLPYDIDLSGFTKTETDEGTTEDGTDTSADDATAEDGSDASADEASTDEAASEENTEEAAEGDAASDESTDESSDPATQQPQEVTTE
ncbi:parvulin peptidyl-prolyl isomerase [Slackia equolifaciens]|uniref:Parvulin peptidyl-prolyl isomerase n=1 Tax=Slackia equolifaciens TaxID=498718 RepID=A0A3N0AT18_9ACTN|nr:peptidylprolyl isomerase [Slackia equolifaciens]RNL37788.1 parvulin peptidyl-prolyl isomerase [Slackia equolifaciens]